MILIDNINNAIREIFDDTKLESIESVYEKIDNSSDLKLIIFFHNIYYNNTNIIYNKLIFITDKTKTKIIENSFLYLYDINDNYTKMLFTDIADFKTKLINIFDKKMFGNDIKQLSDFMKSPVSLINNWLADNKVVDKSVYNFKYEPKLRIMPSKSLFFNFEMNLDDKYDINIILNKNSNHNFKMIIKYNDIIKEIQINKISDMIIQIGMYIKQLK